MFNGAILDLAEKPYIPQKNLLQLVCCKCLAGCNRHIYFWPQRSKAVRGQKHPSEAKNGMKESIYWKKFLMKVAQQPQNPLTDQIRFELWPQVRKIHERPPRSLYKTLLIGYYGHWFKLWSQVRKIHPSDFRGH
jgi:hypothetical protein